ncbi:MAG: type VI secretion system protein TssA, partial [Gammaproteobacteria bacterium]
MYSADQLLNPISPDQPAGEDLAFSPELDAIIQARKFDDPSLDQGEWVTDLKEADWDFVVQRCAALLEKKSKDLRLAVWLTEAGAKQYNMRGLAEGLRVLAGLFDQFWDQGLFPESEDGDHDQRIGNLSWILSQIPTLVREMPITDGSKGAWSLLDFDTVRKQGDSDGRKLADMEAARSQTSAAFRTLFAADTKAALDALAQLERAADKRLGNDSPGFVNARDALDGMVHLIPAPAAEAPVTSAPTAADGVAGEAGHIAVAQAPSGPPGAITHRTQAIAQLRAVAEFFRRTEPHSPVSY